jgi:hypothetical protein
MYVCQTPPIAEPLPTDSSCARVLTRFQWAAGLAFESHGVRLGIQVNDLAMRDETGLWERLCGCLPPGSAPADLLQADCLYSLATVADRSHSTPGHSYFLYRGSCRLAHSRDIDALLQLWESDLHAQVAAHSRERLFVHAGAVGWHGRAIVLPGRSFSGKTTLVRALMQAGATYLSDEYAVLDGNGLIYPYAKPLSLRDEAGSPTGRHSAESLGGQVEDGPLRVGLVLCCRYEAGVRWQPRPLSSGRALLALLDNAVPVREQPARTLETLREVVLAAPAFAGKRGDAGQVITWLNTQFHHPSPDLITN